MRDGVLLVNGQQVTLNTLAGQQTQAGEFPLTKLANGYCFVLNDNRGHAEDSRSFGPVPLGDIIGRAEVVYWPRWVKLRPENK
jgi:signal peptidase I